MAGKTEDEKVTLDQVLELFRDMFEQLWPYIGTIMKFQAGDVDQLRAEKLEKFAPHFERLLKESGTGFFGRSGVSYVDFYIADGIYSLHGFDKELIEKKYPFFVQHYKKVRIY